MHPGFVMLHLVAANVSSGEQQTEDPETLCRGKCGRPGNDLAGESGTSKMDPLISGTDSYTAEVETTVLAFCFSLWYTIAI